MDNHRVASCIESSYMIRSPYPYVIENDTQSPSEGDVEGPSHVLDMLILLPTTLYLLPPISRVTGASRS